MLRKLVHIKTITWALLLMASTASFSYAQTQFPLPTELPLQGEKPVFESGKAMWHVMDDAGTTWIITYDAVWSLNLDSLKWSQWPSLTLEDIEVYPGYDKANKRFLFWNNGIGKVFTWNPGDTTVTRIDKSYHHRTQFGHAWFIHPKTGEIYAFGGQGFWASRGYTIRFDNDSRHWQVLPLDPTKPYPSPRAGSQYSYDEKRNQFHIFGGFDYRNEGREDLSVDFVDFDDYWVLDIERREWRQHPIYGLKNIFGVNREIRRVNESGYYAVLDSVGDIAWYPVRSVEGSHDIQLLAFDNQRNFGAFLPISLGDLGVKSTVRWYSYDARNNHLLIYWLEAMGNYGDGNLRVSALPLPHPDSTRAMMDLIRTYGSINPPSAASTLWTWLLLLLPLSLVGFTVWHRLRKKTIEIPSPDAQTIEKPLMITFCYVNKPKILLNGVEAKIQLSDLELGLLLWLYWKYRRGEPYQITDTIENIFWHNSPNIDYVRKQRNTTLRRLNEQMIDLFKLQGDVQGLIIDRTSISDKRKREYSLDLSGFVVGSDLDTIEPGSIDPSDLLETCSGLWVEQIRIDYTLMRSAS